MIVDSIGNRICWVVRIRVPLESTSLRPLAVHDGLRGELRGINDDVFHLLALPGVGDVDEAVLRLDDGWVAEFLLRLVFKDQRGFPGLAVLAHGEVQWAAALGGVIVDEQMTAIGERENEMAIAVANSGRSVSTAAMARARNGSCLFSMVARRP